MIHLFFLQVKRQQVEDTIGREKSKTGPRKSFAHIPPPFLRKKNWEKKKTTPAWELYPRHPFHRAFWQVVGVDAEGVELSLIMAVVKVRIYKFIIGVCKRFLHPASLGFVRPAS